MDAAEYENWGTAVKLQQSNQFTSPDQQPCVFRDLCAFSRLLDRKRARGCAAPQARPCLAYPDHAGDVFLPAVCPYLAAGESGEAAPKRLSPQSRERETDAGTGPI